MTAITEEKAQPLHWSQHQNISQDTAQWNRKAPNLCCYGQTPTPSKSFKTRIPRIAAAVPSRETDRPHVGVLLSCTAWHFAQKPELLTQSRCHSLQPNPARLPWHLTLTFSSKLPQNSCAAKLDPTAGSDFTPGGGVETCPARCIAEATQGCIQHSLLQKVGWRGRDCKKFTDLGWKGT